MLDTVARLHSISNYSTMRALLLASLAATAAALYDSSDAVIQLTDKDFEKKGSFFVRDAIVKLVCSTRGMHITIR